MTPHPGEVLGRTVASRRRELAERRRQAADIVTVRRAVQGIDLTALHALRSDRRPGGSAQD